MIRLGATRDPFLSASILVVLVSSLGACVIPSRVSAQRAADAPPQPMQPTAQPPWSPQPLPATPPPSLAPSSPASACDTAFLPPFEEPLRWRTAYKGSGAGSYHHCPGWSGFGPVRPNRKWHKGVDIAAPTGAPVRAAVSGTLSYGHDPSGWGFYARLRFTPSHRSATGACEAMEPMELIYAHLLDDIPAQARRAELPVTAGTVVGRVGCSGNARAMCSPSPESHLHLTLRYGTGRRDKIDPLPVVRWSIQEPPPTSFSPPLLACPLAAGQSATASR